MRSSFVGFVAIRTETGVCVPGAFPSTEHSTDAVPYVPGFVPRTRSSGLRVGYLRMPLASFYRDVIQRSLRWAVI